MVDPVVQVVDEATGEIQYTLRISGTTFRPWTFGPGAYSVRIGEPGTPRWTTIEGLPATVGSKTRVQVRL